jgi:hypothetical protein
MNITALLRELFQGKPEPLETRIQKLLRRFLAGNIAAEQTLREVAGMWDSLYNEEFALALIKAIKNAKSKEAIPYMEIMTEAKAQTSSQVRVQQAAQECLTALTT